MGAHYVRIESIAGWDMSVDLWLECSCGWKSSETESSMDIDLAYLTAMKHKAQGN